MTRELDPERPMSLMERRRFLQGALAAGGAVAAGPALFADQAGAASTGSDTILVTVTLSGGNDGINTFGPFGSGTYRDLRGRMAINLAGAHAAGESQYFHPSLRRLATRFRRGDVAVVRGVGDPLLDRSHFSNLARWQAGLPDGRIAGTGWLGRWLDTASTSQFTGVAIGGQGVPLHLRGSTADVTDLPRHGGGLYGSDRSDQRDQRMYRAIRQMGKESNRPEWVNRVGKVNAHSIDAAQSVAGAYRTDLPEGRLLPDMVLAARLVNLNLGTRVLNVWHSGYDTHDNQIGGNSGVGDHADLLTELDAALDSFFNTLSAPMAPRVIVMVYSEFGRRVEPNGSSGTDHGTANHVFFLGRRVKGGLYGDPPPLRSLDERGDLKVSMDFRQLYTTVIEDVLGGSGSDVLGRSYKTHDLFGSDGEVVGDLKTRAQQIRERRERAAHEYLLRHTPSF